MMSQAIAKASQTASHLYKVCTSQRYYYSYMKNYTSLSSAATNETFDYQNAQSNNYASNNNSYFTGNNDRFEQNPSSENYVTSNRLYEQGRNVQNTYMMGNQQSSAWGNLQSNGMNCTQPDEDGGTIEEFDALCKEGKLKEAVEVLGLLERNNVSVDMDRYLFLMNECGEAQALEEAKRVHEHVVRLKSCLDVTVWNKVLEMYVKCGSMEGAYKVFDKMSQTSWDTMITWLAKNGHGEDAIDMFAEFKKIGLKPDNQMFFGVFSACSVLGDMREGLLHFESMSKIYNITPSINHYRSVVDMLGSAGYLNEALEFIENMPIEPSVEVWETMMNQCRIHGDTELGDRCLELLDPSRLDEQSKAGLIPVKASDIAKEKEKKRLEIKTKVYEYRAGDTSHPEHEKLYSQLRCLKQPMKEAGYVPETKFVLHDIDQESKEEALLSHSERLALSQALSTSPARSPIRIIKNLRVCGDCHNALKIISKLVGRLIVARDAKRFHHFENGVCSCGDYW
ncbi:putative tetratricopeptide-like helical domain superfamily, DYW domain-containing protein [Helianthus annuus]|uniref:Putative pentatricopeptide repeat (PPR) superfamily protein n=1 Tax=Helianthus annuus TaxID=4232 RepID=A0A251T4I7_HELAN|nr:putative tetratricopeptide-like helical domain superfamily, DYW domain-containing protein [Helianthus annuus]KAJ0726913.1 putative tetratricopeptide-like helical domain superfamily, DYW domain-containing protein [Helianthus annuus]KAJ0868106.1 putative tetratricopeptide-like helical domain superfamily, DYW domain-containing protein [Helianthus annuus]